MAKNLEEVVEQLNAAVIAHGKQAKTVQKHIKEMNRAKAPAMKQEFPEIDKKDQGKFKRWVKKNMPNESTCSAAAKIMKAKEGKYTGNVRKMANYANNMGCKNK